MIRSWRIKYLIAMGSLLVVTIGYNNCSNDATFDLRSGVNSLEEYNSGPSTTEEERAPADPKILINNDAVYTQERGVSLSLDSGNPADQMLVSNFPDCSNGSWEPYRQNKAWDLSAVNQEVRVYVSYRFQDNQPSECISDSIVHDDIAPQVLFTQGVGSIWIKDPSVRIRFTVSDSGSGVRLNECQNSGGNFKACTDNYYYSGLVENQNYQLAVRSTDNAGNQSDPVVLNWQADFTSPVVSINERPAAVTSDITPNFSFSAVELGSGIDRYEYQLDGVGNYLMCSAACAENLQLSGLSEGPHSLSVRAVDNVGHVSQTESWNWVQDSMAPTVEYTNKPNRYSNSPAAHFAFRQANGGTDITGFYCGLDNSNMAQFTICTSPRTISGLADGDHTHYVYGTDGVNNSSPLPYKWTVDTVAPTIKFVNQPDPLERSNSATFSFEAKDDRSGVDRIECRLDSGAYAPCATTEVLTNLSPGTHRLYAMAYDRAGNPSSEISYQWTIDVTGPNVTINNGPGAKTRNPSGVFEFSATDNYTNPVTDFQCRVDGGSPASCMSGYQTPDLPDGEHVFYVRARDEAGNWSVWAQYPWLIDTTPPTIILVFQPQMVHYIGSPTRINFYADDGIIGSGVKTYSCLFGSDPYVCNGGVTYDFPSNQVTSHSFQITVYDEVGNFAVKTLEWEVREASMAETSEYTISGGRPVDILFVVDNSGSMYDEREEMGNKISNFFGQLDGIDWQAALIATNNVRGTYYRDGIMLPFDDGGNYILSSSQDPTLVQNLFKDRVLSLKEDYGNGWWSGVDEQGIFAAKRAIEHSFQGTNDYIQIHDEFFREGASLEVVLISDEDENSNGNNVPVSPQQFISFVNETYEGQKNLTWHSIIDPPSSSDCSGSYNYEGHTYALLSNLTNGSIGNICASNYSSQLAGLGQSVVSNQKKFTMKCSPLDQDGDGAGDVSVERRDNASSPYSPYNADFNVSGYQVIFDDVLPAGQYRFSYECPPMASP